jgi:hypothetical protein
MGNRSRQQNVFPRKMVLFEKLLADHHADVQMNVDEPTARLVIAQEAQERWMVPVGNRRKQLEVPAEQDCLGVV